MNGRQTVASPEETGLHSSDASPGMTTRPHVLVAGAGPVGLTAALALAEAGIAVTVAEKRPALSAASRASTFHPPTLAILHRLGVLDEVHHRGQVADRVQYRTASDGIFAEFALAALKDETAFPVSPAPRAGAGHADHPRASARLSRTRACCSTPKCSSVAQHGRASSCASRHGVGHETLDGDYLIAADGSRSDVRAALGIAFDGEDYPDKILRVMTATTSDGCCPASRRSPTSGTARGR